jgi:organic radical activating enzyme
MVKIAVQEIIPLTVQGEGRNAGMPCSFIRLFGCPVGCYFCDTGYAEGQPIPGHESLELPQVLSQLLSVNCVVSGGEPVVNPRFPELCDQLLSNGFNVFVETSGVKWREELKSCWVTFSPKDHVFTQKSDPVFWQKAQEIKIVIAKQDDLFFYEKKIIEALFNRKIVYLQPEWSVLGDVLPLLINFSNLRGTLLSTQTHKFLGVR